LRIPATKVIPTPAEFHTSSSVSNFYNAIDFPTGYPLARQLLSSRFHPSTALLLRQIAHAGRGKETA
jgi:hypothetical protein